MELRLVRGDVGEEVAGLKGQPGGDLSVGGATLASTLVKLDRIDEYRLYVNPVVLGGGTLMLPQVGRPISLRPMETRTFGSGVTLLRYERPGQGAARSP